MPSADTTAPLGNYIDVKHGFAFEGRYFCDEPTPHVLVTPGNFAIGGGFQEGKAKFYNGPVPDDYVLREGDLIVTMTDLSKAGDTLGFPALVPVTSGLTYLHNQRIGLVSIIKGDELDRDYLFYVLRTDAYRHHVLATASGSTVRHTSPGRIRDFVVALPSLGEQKAVVSVLRSLDDKIEQNRRGGRKLEALARATFKAWFVDFEPVKAKADGATTFPGMPPATFSALPARFTSSPLGPVPEGWELKPLSAVCKLISGGTPKRSEPTFWGGDIPWYSVKDAPHDGMPWVYFTEEQITQKGLDESAANLVPTGCTIISARGTVGKLAMAGREMTFNQFCYGLLPADGRSFRFLNVLMNDAVVRLQQRTHGSVFDTITRQTFDGLLVVVPPKEVMQAFDAAVTPLFDLQLAQLRESAKLVTLRDYLLPRLLNGQVRVKNVKQFEGGRSRAHI